MQCMAEARHVSVAPYRTSSSVSRWQRRLTKALRGVHASPPALQAAKELTENAAASEAATQSAHAEQEHHLQARIEQVPPAPFWQPLALLASRVVMHLSGLAWYAIRPLAG